MAEIFAETDVAISAAGSICWELCMMGLPAMLIDVADNQTAIATELARRGCAIHAGDRKVSAERLADQLKRLAGSHEIRQSLSQRSRELVDGYGALRVVSVLRRAEGVRLRRARAEDMRLLWEWANDPEVRAASFSADPIPWETHTAWFAEKFSEKRSLIFIAEDGDGTPYGQIRFDLNGGEAFLNISLAKERRGIGLAIPLIETGVRELFANSGCETVHAFVKIQNAASARAFERAGFARVGVEQVRENTAVHFTCSRR